MFKLCNLIKLFLYTKYIIYRLNKYNASPRGDLMLLICKISIQNYMALKYKWLPELNATDIKYKGSNHDSTDFR